MQRERRLARSLYFARCNWQERRLLIGDTTFYHWEVLFWFVRHTNIWWIHHRSVYWDRWGRSALWSTDGTVQSSWPVVSSMFCSSRAIDRQSLASDLPRVDRNTFVRWRDPDSRRSHWEDPNLYTDARRRNLADDRRWMDRFLLTSIWKVRSVSSRKWMVHG